MTELEIIEKLRNTSDICDEELLRLLTMPSGLGMEELFPNTPILCNGEESEKVQLPLHPSFTTEEEALFAAADEVRQENYGKDVFVRGLIEFTNYCKNNCYYCGIRGENCDLKRYRLSDDQILECCREGYELGFRTFVLQGGEDLTYTDEDICRIITRIKVEFPKCAITLSLGEKERQSYQKYYDAGADRYLLRHETATEEHYRKLHPEAMSLSNRIRCLYDLKEIGYQIGAGFMVGSLEQTPETLVADFRFLQKLQPDMIGIGPYLVHKSTPFRNQRNGSLAMTLRCLAILRLMFPYALLPATTALGTIHPLGREMGLSCGGNVVMPNCSPTEYRRLYSLYENKICVDDVTKQCKSCLSRRAESRGYHIVVDRGDVHFH